MKRLRSTLPALMLSALMSGAVALGVPGSAWALRAPADLEDLDEADEAALETIATHSPALRDAALEASLHVDALVETQRIQDQTSAAFRERIETLDREGQEQMWELVREPGLVEELASADAPSAARLDAIAARYPEELAPAIRGLGAQHHALLVDVAHLERDAHQRFETVIEDLPEPTREAFRELVRQPELLTLLAKQVRLTVYLGDSYRADPEGTRQHLAALSQEVAERNREAEQDWVEAIDADPEAAEELAASARTYAAENGYDYEQLTQPEVRTTVNIVVRPYPYWFGYPIWYPSVAFYPWGYWYPYPLHFGFYYRGGSAFFFGLPSVGFLSWYYRGPSYGYYGRLSNCFARYGGAHPYARTHSGYAVRQWSHGGQPGPRRGWARSGSGGTSRAEARGFASRDRGDFFVRRSNWSRGDGDATRGGGWHRERRSPADRAAADRRSAPDRGTPGFRGGDRTGDRRERPGFARSETRREGAGQRSSRSTPDRASPGQRRGGERAESRGERRERRANPVIVHRGNEGAPRAVPDRERARDRGARDRRSNRDERMTRGRDRQRIEVRGPAVSGDTPRARPAARAERPAARAERPPRVAPADRGGAGMRRIEVAPARRAPGPRVPTAQPSGRRGGPRAPGGAGGAGGRFGMRGPN